MIGGFQGLRSLLGLRGLVYVDELLNCYIVTLLSVSTLGVADGAFLPFD